MQGCSVHSVPPHLHQSLLHLALLVLLSPQDVPGWTDVQDFLKESFHGELQYETPAHEVGPVEVVGTVGGHLGPAVPVEHAEVPGGEAQGGSRKLRSFEAWAGTGTHAALGSSGPRERMCTWASSMLTRQPCMQEEPTWAPPQAPHTNGSDSIEIYL